MSDTGMLERDILRLAQQEERLQFERFDREAAWDLGCRIRALCQSHGVSLAIEVRLGRQSIFWCSMPGTSGVNEDWVRRKRNTVELFERSSYAVGRELERDAETLEAKMGLSTRDFASFGGGFPIIVAGLGCVGAVTVSGAPQRQDHALVVEALAGMCGVPLPEVVLELD
ncbi:heme-degrading domain-containing protein [Variovorax guangxiensis]|uniref:heme-degrading domain-containing protein n=1 Tax=Variovorax guangxiensis TaxID=1775474 RepID=UPI0028612D8F|nr:heme-degrading domain-containing protein [Variovorax guangxiensis]MDR6860465.1 uncharacterized protein (UPF0303 family) [Variovorax guangxiensis]